MNAPWACIGHSHVLALSWAGDAALDPINFWVTGEPWLTDGDETSLRPDLAERVGAAAVVLSVIGGSAHTVLGLVEHHRPFDFVLPSDPDLPTDETREPTPAQAVRQTLAELNSAYLDKIPVVMRYASGPVICLEPPPPVADASRIAPNVPWSYFPGQPRRVAPKWLRYKLWRMQSEVMEAACGRFGVRYAAAPDSAKDDEGFLHPRYDEDGVHANAAYGALVLEGLRRLEQVA
jgi:hypothetical protein